MDENRPPTPQQTIDQLTAYAKHIQSHDPQLESSLRNYVSLYISTHKHNEDSFICLCEHQVIQKLFGVEGQQMGAISVLQEFNLILANTSQVDRLVFVFSQPCLHEYLFERFNIQEQSSQAVQYYVQLLKTIVMKINNGLPSLIKLFCNNRYASFPLLARTTFLAVHYPQELVQITAQQCVLLLIGLLAQKKVGEGYLVQTQMAIFYHQLTCQLRNGNDIESSLSYLGDLVCVLQNQQASLCMLMNSFTLNVLLPSLKNLPLLLKILLKWSDTLEDQKMPPQLCLQIKLVTFRIVSKVLFSQFLNGSYIQSLRLVKNYLQEGNSYPQRDKICKFTQYFNTRFQKLQPLLQQFDQPVNLDKQSSPIMLDLADYLQNNSPRKAPQGKKGGIFGFFATKLTPFDLYLTQAFECNGFNFDKANMPLFKLSSTLHLPTALYFIERLLLREQISKQESPFQGFEAYQVYFNDYKAQIVFDQPFCHSLLEFMTRLEQKGINLSNSHIERERLRESQPQYNFLHYLRKYLSTHLPEHMPTVDKHHSGLLLHLLSRILKGLGVGGNMDRNMIKKLMWQMQKLQNSINQLTFQNDFKGLIQYVLADNRQSLVAKDDLQPNIKQLVCSKVYHYELLAILIDPQILTMGQYAHLQWDSFLSLPQNKQRLSLTTQYGQCSIRIVPNSQLEFEIQIDNQRDHSQSQVNGKEQSILEGELKRWVKEQQFQELEKPNFRNEHPIAGLARLCSQRQEILTKAIVQYFQSTYSRLSTDLSKAPLKT